MKKILALMLLVGVGIVWIPQILAAATKSAPPPRIELPAEVGDGGAGTSTIHTPNSESTTVDSSESAGGEDAAEQDSDDLARKLETSITKAKQILPEKTGLDLDRLASAWSAPVIVTEPTPKTPTPVVSLDPTPVAEKVPSIQVDVPTLRDPIDDFLATHPLQGTLISQSRRTACLGPLVLSVGDEPVRGLSVTAIEANHVTFSRNGGALRVELTPFQARAPITQSSNTNPNAGASQNQSGVTASGTVTTTSAISELDRLLPLLKEAAAASDAKPSNGSVGSIKSTPNVVSDDKKNGNGS